MTVLDREWVTGAANTLHDVMLASVGFGAGGGVAQW